MIVPGLDILPPGGARAAAHICGDKELKEGSFKGVFAFSDDSEIAISKRFLNEKGSQPQDPIISGKFKIRPNVALAGIFDGNDNYKSSLMLLSGVAGNKAVLGIGANVSLSGDQRYAHFGRYENRDAQVDPLFFVLGAGINLDPETVVTVDYAGNDFVVGLRHNLSERMTVDFGYYTPDRLNRSSRYLIGANFGF